MHTTQVEILKDLKGWTDADSALAMFEGWCITNTSQGNLCIAKFDEAGRFQFDEDAAEFVMESFAKGNGLAAKAIKHLITAGYEL